MAEEKVKLNKDGLEPGKIISQSDYKKVMAKKIKANARKVASGK